MSPRDRFAETQFTADPALAGLLPLDLCLERLAVVIEQADAPDTLRVGVIDPSDRDLLALLRARLKRSVEPVQLNAFQVRQALAVQHGLPVHIEGISVRLRSDSALSFEPDLPPSRILNDLLGVAVRRGASDVHIEVFQSSVDVRLRVDGMLRELPTPISPDNVTRIVSRLKILSDLDPVEHRHSQDGHFSALYEEDDERRRVDFRVSVLPGTHGEDCVLRVVDPVRFRLDIDELGIGQEVLGAYKRLIGYPNGLVLVAGPTVSGKTNTLYATVGTLRAQHVKIVTVEDPIEYDFPRITQKNVTAEMGFAAYIRAFLRQNPDVILVGEIRDEETAETVVQAATTGHLVLSSVHTRGAVSTIARLRSLGVSDEYISDILIAALGQRLCGRICPDCRERRAPPPELVPLYYAEKPDHPFFEGRGCEKCQGTGFAGLVGIFELLEVDEQVRAAIAQGASMDRIRQIASGGPYSPLHQDALDRVRAGETTLAEVARKIHPPFPQGARA